MSKRSQSIDVADLQLHGLAQSQTTGIDGGKEDAVNHKERLVAACPQRGVGAPARPAIGGHSKGLSGATGRAGQIAEDRAGSLRPRGRIAHGEPFPCGSGQAGAEGRRLPAVGPAISRPHDGESRRGLAGGTTGIRYVQCSNIGPRSGELTTAFLARATD